MFIIKWEGTNYKNSEKYKAIKLKDLHKFFMEIQIIIYFLLFYFYLFYVYEQFCISVISTLNIFSKTAFYIKIKPTGR